MFSPLWRFMRPLRRKNIILAGAQLRGPRAVGSTRRNIPDKSRQQLQVLRDLDLLEFLSPGSYRLK